MASDYPSHAFISEGLAEYLSVVYVDWVHGQAAGRQALIDHVGEPYAETLEYDGDAVPDLSAVNEDEMPGIDPGIVYSKAALGFHAIRLEIGDDAFFAALRSYAEAHAFGFATPSDLRGAFEDAAGDDLGGLWRFWFEEDGSDVEDVRDLLRAA